jgi:hypothetical protein
MHFGIGALGDLPSWAFFVAGAAAFLAILFGALLVLGPRRALATTDGQMQPDAWGELRFTVPHARAYRVWARVEVDDEEDVALAVDYEVSSPEGVIASVAGQPLSGSHWWLSGTTFTALAFRISALPPGTPLLVRARIRRTGGSALTQVLRVYVSK